MRSEGVPDLLLPAIPVAPCSLRSHPPHCWPWLPAACLAVAPGQVWQLQLGVLLRRQQQPLVCVWICARRSQPLAAPSAAAAPGAGAAQAVLLSALRHGALKRSAAPTAGWQVHAGNCRRSVSAGSAASSRADSCWLWTAGDWGVVAREQVPQLVSISLCQQLQLATAAAPWRALSPCYSRTASSCTWCCAIG